MNIYTKVGFGCQLSKKGCILLRYFCGKMKKLCVYGELEVELTNLS